MIIREIALLVSLIKADLSIRFARAWFWFARVPTLLLRSAFQKQSWPHKKSVFGHTLDVVRAVWKRRSEFAQLGVHPWHALQAAVLHDLGKPQVAKRRRDGHGWVFPNHELVMAEEVLGVVHPHVWYLVCYHHLPEEREWSSPEEVARVVYGCGLDLYWAKVASLFAECNGEGLNVQRLRELLGVIERNAKFATCRVCGGWSPTFPVETLRGPDYRTACCEL